MVETAFQDDAFQVDAFQIVSPTPTGETVHQGLIAPWVKLPPEGSLRPASQMHPDRGIAPIRGTGSVVFTFSIDGIGNYNDDDLVIEWLEATDAR